MARNESGGGFNFVSFALLLALAGGVYGAVKFGPPHWRKWQAKEVLDDTVSRFLGNRAPSAEVDIQLAAELREGAITRLRALGIVDPGLDVTIERQGLGAKVAASYQEVVRHPFVNKISVLIFRPTVVRERKP
ncbi:MAG: hypothetical protein IPL40_11265 [Proteobacteria bacterium]|nr:hypothetical protein [Pseudomonadota bacterium]